MKNLFLFFFIWQIFAFEITAQSLITNAIAVNVNILRPTFMSSNLAKANNEVGFSLKNNLYFDLSSKQQVVFGLGAKFIRNDFVDFSPVLTCDFSNTGEVHVENSFRQNRKELIYLNTPLQIRIKLLGDKNHLYSSFGVDFWYKVYSTQRDIFHECDRNSFSTKIAFEPKTLILLVNSNLGYEVFMSKTIKLFVESEFSHSINKVYSNNFISINEAISESRFFLFGLTLGIRFI